MMWPNELVSSTSWKPCHQARVERKQHINILELTEAVETLARESHSYPSTRQLALFVSRVAIGALAKGRSASSALNPVLQHNLPHFLGNDSYYGVSFTPTRLQPADAPSRFQPVRPPRQQLRHHRQRLRRRARSSSP